jgi:hypothetical protein
MQELSELFSVFASPDYKSLFLKTKASDTRLVYDKNSVRFPSLSTKLKQDISALCQEHQSGLLNGIDFDLGFNYLTEVLHF